MSTELNKLNTWFKVNKLSLNVSKTNFMIFVNSNRNCAYNVAIDSVDIEQVNCTKFLGVLIDRIITWCDHVNNLRKKIVKMYL